VLVVMVVLVLLPVCCWRLQLTLTDAADVAPVAAFHSFIHSCYTCGRSSYKQRLPIPDAANSQLLLLLQLWLHML
jgi:hypothetical protein